MITRIYESNTLVILDNGHGVNTPGKRSPVWSDGTQLLEWEYTRNIVKYITPILDSCKISYTILVPETVDLSLTDRVIRANKVYKANTDKKVYLVSIHGNAADNKNANGIEVFTSKGTTLSDKIVPIFYKELEKLGWVMRPTSKTKLDKEEDFYIIKNTICPAILTENGFYTNEKECKLMLKKEIQQKIAELHANAIKYIEDNVKTIWA